MKHPHAELMMLYAQDAMETDKPWERWEFFGNNNTWIQFESGHPSWNIHGQYRRKPRTININGFEVPEPVRDVLKNGERYWYPEFDKDFLADWHIWNSDNVDMNLLKNGMIHLTQEAAALHGRALASFTERK